MIIFFTIFFKKLTLKPMGTNISKKPLHPQNAFAFFQTFTNISSQWSSDLSRIFSAFANMRPYGRKSFKTLPLHKSPLTFSKRLMNFLHNAPRQSTLIFLFFDFSRFLSLFFAWDPMGAKTSKR